MAPRCANSLPRQTSRVHALFLRDPCRSTQELHLGPVVTRQLRGTRLAQSEWTPNSPTLAYKNAASSMVPTRDLRASWPNIFNRFASYGARTSTTLLCSLVRRG
jgi:hypothetical protein